MKDYWKFLKLIKTLDEETLKSLDEKQATQEKKEKEDNNNAENEGKEKKEKEDNGNAENEKENGGKYAWRKPLIETEKLNWKKRLLADIESEDLAKDVVKAKEEWRGSLIAKLGEDMLWKAPMILGAMDRTQAGLIREADTEAEAEAIARVTQSCYWKLGLWGKVAPWMVPFLDQCESEDLANTLVRCERQWQAELIISRPSSLEVWRAECVAACCLQWQGPLVMQCWGEEQARAVSSCTKEWVARGVARLREGEAWKLEVLRQLKAPWQLEPVLQETDRRMVKLLAALSTSDRLEAVVAAAPLEEWKMKILERELEDWKFQLLLPIQEEEAALLIANCGAKAVCHMLAEATDSWRLNALIEASNASFGLAEIVSRVSEEWQARLVLLGHGAKLDMWRLQQIPNITHEEMAANYLFTASMAQLPRWKFLLGLKLAQTDDPLAAEKAEFMFQRMGDPRWKVEMAARCSEGWRLAHLGRIGNKGVGQLYMEAEEEWRGRLLASLEEEWKAELVAGVQEEWKVLLIMQHATREERWRLRLIRPLTMEWQVKFVLIAPEVWKAEMIAKLREDQEMLARDLLGCSTKNFAQEVVGGLLEIYYA